MVHYGYWWRRNAFVSGRSPTRLSIFDDPVEGSQLDLVRAFPVRNQAGTLLDIQPQLFRNTQDPDTFRKEVYPNRPKARKPILDSWQSSSWGKPQGPMQKRLGREFFEWLRGEVTYRGLHQQHHLPDWLMGARMGMFPPPQAPACIQRRSSTIGPSCST